MKILTAQQMGYVDKTTIKSGIPGLTLMRNAGKAVFELISEKALTDTGARILVLAGKGNNGGDGFRTAELLVLNGYHVELYLAGKRKDVRGDALTCLNDAEAAGLAVTEMHGDNDPECAAQSIKTADVIVDALFGTGLKGNIKGLAASVVSAINDSGATVVAIDVPSGVNASTGEVSAETVQAHYTVTFGCLKAGHVFGPGKQKCGNISVVEIGFNRKVMDSTEPVGYALTLDEAAELLPERAYNAYKGSVGRVFILSGSVGLTGAAVLSSQAAMRVGSGLVTVGCPASLNDILEVKLTEVMTLPLPEVRKKRCLSLRAMGMVRDAAKKADIVAVGPGLGRYHETTELVRRFIEGFSGRVVLDADGINAFKGYPDVLAGAPCEIVLTPHVGELARLMEQPSGEILEDPGGAAKNAALRTGKVVLLKGAPTIIANPDGTVWINPTGNESMATAGMGDVLTGTITGLAAQGLTLFDAAVLGAYVHGRAGELASENLGIPGIIAGDVTELLPRTIKEIAGRE